MNLINECCLILLRQMISLSSNANALRANETFKATVKLSEELVDNAKAALYSLHLNTYQYPP